MGPAIYIMAILGCGEGEAACEQVGVVRARYESAAACNAQTAQAVEQNLSIPYPVVVAECRPGGAALASAPAASDIRLPPPPRTGVGERIRMAERRGAAR